MFPACLVSTIFVAQNAVCNGFGCGLGGRAGEHHEHQLGVCGPMGGLRWAVFRAPQYERACIADIKHQSCRYCCRTWFWGRFDAVPMAPKHEKGNTTGDHDAADARVRRARARCTRASACLIRFVARPRCSFWTINWNNVQSAGFKLDAEGSDSRSGDGHAGPCRQALQ